MNIIDDLRDKKINDNVLKSYIAERLKNLINESPVEMNATHLVGKNDNNMLFVIFRDPTDKTTLREVMFDISEVIE